MYLIHICTFLCTLPNYVNVNARQRNFVNTILHKFEITSALRLYIFTYDLLLHTPQKFKALNRIFG